MRLIAFPPALAAALAAAVGAPRARATRPGVSSSTGRIVGVATIAPVLSRRHLRIRAYDEPGTPPPKPLADADAVQNVVIYLQGGEALRQAAAPIDSSLERPVMRQEDEAFVPHVLPIRVGTTVEFPNGDPLFHDVFSLSSTKTFELHRYPQGESRTVTFARPGVVDVFCHIHSDMAGYIVVVDNGYYTIPDSAGAFHLDGVPPGDYRLVAWYERSGPVVARVHVDAGGVTRQDMQIPVPAVSP